MTFLRTFFALIALAAAIFALARAADPPEADDAVVRRLVVRAEDRALLRCKFQHETHAVAILGDVREAEPSQLPG